MTKNQRNEYLRSLASGEAAIAEIVTKVAAGEWMLNDSKYSANLCQRRFDGASDGWAPVKGFHPMTIRAAKARLVPRLDTQWGVYVYGVAA